MQAMTADEFYRGVLLGSNKGTDFDDKTNIIWFEPRIFTTIEADFLDTGIREYQNKFPKMFADRNIRYDKERKEMTYNAEFNNENCIVYLQALINTYAVLRLD